MLLCHQVIVAVAITLSFMESEIGVHSTATIGYQYQEKDAPSQSSTDTYGKLDNHTHLVQIYKGNLTILGR